MTTITDKKQYPSDQYLNELITNMEFAARAPVEVVRVMAAELQKRREADSAEPVSQTYKSQHTQFEQVADLYEMQFDDGRTCAFHTDAQKAAQWLQACDGNRVQEYVKLERLRNALSGNSPGTPDSWISCSERMPDNGQWCVVNTEYGYYVQCWSEGQGWLGDDISIPECDVINWMPLPEPPQEVK
ncbi:DUF551 domain-containing protein [Escherichia coli]